MNTSRETAMTLLNSELRALHQACAKLKKGPDYRCDDYIGNLLNTVLDFQMRSPVVLKSITYFWENHEINTHKKLEILIARFPDTYLGNLQLANNLWGNNHWSRAKFLRVLMRCLDQRGIRGQKSLGRWFRNTDFEADVKGKFKTQEHSIGFVLFHWLCLRLGLETVKPDVHVRNFVRNVIGRAVPDREIVTALTAIAHRLPSQERRAYRLDAAIWHWQQQGRGG
jgi:hypothetical protein